MERLFMPNAFVSAPEAITTEGATKYARLAVLGLRLGQTRLRSTLRVRDELAADDHAEFVDDTLDSQLVL